MRRISGIQKKKKKKNTTQQQQKKKKQNFFLLISKKDFVSFFPMPCIIFHDNIYRKELFYDKHYINTKYDRSVP